MAEPGMVEELYKMEKRGNCPTQCYHCRYDYHDECGRGIFFAPGGFVVAGIAAPSRIHVFVRILVFPPPRNPSNKQRFSLEA